MGRHRSPGAPDPPDPLDGPPVEPSPPETSPPESGGDAGRLLQTTLRVERYAVAPANLICAVALAVNQPGPSPALLFLQLVAPLPVWTVLFAAATVLLVVRRSEPGHVAAFTGWAMISIGAVIGLVTGSTTSPSGSVILTGTTMTMAGLHLAGLLYHRAARVHRAQAG